MLNREQILAASAKPAGTLHIEEWGGDVGIRRLTVAQVEALHKLAEDSGEDELGFLRYTAELALVDENNRELFHDDNRVDHLGYSTLQAVGMALYEANYMTADSRERLRKNSIAALTCATG